jgi:hypothetical protein
VRAVPRAPHAVASPRPRRTSFAQIAMNPSSPLTAAAAAAALVPGTPQADGIKRTAAGATQADITAAVDAFRARGLGQRGQPDRDAGALRQPRAPGLLGPEALRADRVERRRPAPSSCPARRPAPRRTPSASSSPTSTSAARSRSSASTRPARPWTPCSFRVAAWRRAHRRRVVQHRASASGACA